MIKIETKAIYYTKVIVQYSSGAKAQGVKVALSISGIISGGVTKNFYTDRHGVAIISHESRGSGKVMVKGTTRATVQVPCETVVFI